MGAPRSEPQQARSRDKRDRILAAAAALFAERPYAEVSTKLIAERAGVAVGSLYRLYPDRDSIGAALLSAWLEQLMARFTALAASPPPDPGAFLAAMTALYAGFFRTEPGFRTVFYDAPRTPALAEAQHASDDELAALLLDVLRIRYGLDGLASRCLLAIQVTDFLMGRAFASQPGGDPVVLAELDRLLRRYLDVSD